VFCLRSVCIHPDRLAESLKEIGWSRHRGCWRRVLDAHPDEPEPHEGQPPQSSPEQDCLVVGGKILLRGCRKGQALCIGFLLVGLLGRPKSFAFGRSGGDVASYGFSKTGFLRVKDVDLCSER
jgi:hypothetical protein